VANFGNLEMTNATLSGNSANVYGGGLDNGGVATLTNVTLSNNSALQGGGIYNELALVVNLKNSLVANSPQGGNCGGDPITSDKYSLSSDNTCSLAGAGSLNGVDPLLTPLGDFGGWTLVHMLKTGSPAIDGVAGSDAPFFDQRGQPRPAGGGYDIGAVERQPTDSDLPPLLYLPMVIK
jgi:predicted outer membrane repeat protein